MALPRYSVRRRRKSLIKGKAEVVCVGPAPAPEQQAAPPPHDDYGGGGYGGGGYGGGGGY
jgi:hypothetical protein